MNDQTPHPLDTLAKLEVVAAAFKKCPHCMGGNEIVRSQTSTPGVFRLAIEHHHDPGCPDHEDQRPAAGAV